jgi:hypothetical protein
VLNQNVKWISPLSKGLSTNFSRVREEWAIASKASWNAGSTAMTNWSQDGMTLEFLRPKCLPRRTAIVNLKTMGVESRHELSDALRALLPDGADEILAPAGHHNASDSGFALERFTDDPTSKESIIDQALNQKWLAAMQRQIFGCYTKAEEGQHGLCNSKGQMLEEAFAAFEEKVHTFLQAFVCHFQAAAPIPPREATLGAYRFRTDKEEDRNLFVIQGHLVLAWGKEKGEKVRGKRNGSLIVIAPGADRDLLAFLAFVLPIRMYAKQKLGQNRPLLDSAIIVEGGALWKAKMVNTAVKRVTQRFLGVKLDTRDLRQVMSSIFVIHFPDLVLVPAQRPETGPNLVADHTGVVSENNYGLGNSTPYNMPPRTTALMIRTCLVWQAFQGLRPMDPLWAELCQRSVILIRQEHMRLALDAARGLVQSHYHLLTDSTGDPADSAARAKQKIRALLSEHPWFGNKEVSCVSLTMVQPVALLMSKRVSRPETDQDPSGMKSFSGSQPSLHGVLNSLSSSSMSLRWWDTRLRMWHRLQPL